MRRIAIIQGHPDSSGTHLCHALADAYAEGAEEAGHGVDRIEVAKLEFPWLRTKGDYEADTLPPSLAAAADAIRGCDHLLIIYPLWLGTMPAVLKAFFEQVFRPGFTFRYDGKWGVKLLKGKTARIVVTMGMPALIYRWYFGAHSLRSLERNILAFCGIGPVKENLFGLVENASDAKRQRWLTTLREAGRAGR